MNTIEYYIELRIAYPKISELIPIVITSKQLANKLCCSLRNVRNLMNKMEHEGFILWEPGKGRGNPSKLTFLCPLSNLIIQRFQEFIDKNDMTGALLLVNREGVPADIRKKCYKLLLPEFGFRVSSVESISQAASPTSDDVITLKHMVMNVHNHTSNWQIGKQFTTPMMQWPITKKHKF